MPGCKPGGRRDVGIGYVGNTWVALEQRAAHAVVEARWTVT